MANCALKQLHLEAKSRKGQGGGVPRALPKPQPQGGPLLQQAPQGQVVAPMPPGSMPLPAAPEPVAAAGHVTRTTPTSSHLQALTWHLW